MTADHEKGTLALLQRGLAELKLKRKVCHARK